MPDKIMRQKINERLKPKTPDQQIVEIEKLLHELPSVGEYRRVRSELEHKLERLKRVVTSRSTSLSEYHIKKEIPQMVLIGLPSSGKSTLLSQLTSAKPAISGYPYTTQKPELGSMEYNDLRIQLVDLPAIYENCYENNRELFSIIRNSDGVLNVVNQINEIDVILSELRKAKIYLYRQNFRPMNDTNNTYLPSIVIYRSTKPQTDLPTIKFSDLDSIKDSIYKSLNIKRIYSKREDGSIDLPPIFFMKDFVSVEDFITKINKKLLQHFKYAKVWGSSAKYSGEMCGLKKQLYDGDHIRLYFK